uniref:Uncharacterized protein n=1 Tax=Rhizophora mucronata TaxID=61149 RepID=A0A2P2Q9F1_RHIMU
MWISLPLTFIESFSIVSSMAGYD